MTGHIYSCKCHGRPYTVCPECQHQYCNAYWSGCPSCATAALVADAGRDTPGPWYVSPLDIGRGVIRWVIYRGQQNMGEYLTASAACEALLLWTDYARQVRLDLDTIQAGEMRAAIAKREGR